LNENFIFTELFVGEYDRIIPISIVRSFSDKLANKKFIILKSGHNNLLDEVAFQFENAAEKR
jgi:pimeloyl-ACP methyl ester carboxylesterase